MSKNWIIAGVAAVCSVRGVALSHRIKPDISVEKVIVTTNPSALRLLSAT
jgi:hypothetical protein